MKLLLLAAVFAMGAFSQAVQLGFSGASAGTSFSRDITISSQGAQPAGVQFTLTWPATITGVILTAAAQATSAGKSLFCGGTQANPDGTFWRPCLVAGISVNTIANGALVRIDFTVAKNAGSGFLSLVGGALPPLSVSLSADAILTAGGTTTIPFSPNGTSNSDVISSRSRSR